MAVITKIMTNAKKQVVYGRPRLLTHEQILEGALTIGLQGLTIKKLADHLQVGAATLYHYWKSRKELVQAAAVYALSDIELPENTGQHWSLYTQQYVECVATILSENPSLLNSYHFMDFGMEIQFKIIEQFLEVMVDTHGFTPADAMRLLNIVGMAAFAGAVEKLRQEEFELHDETMQTAVQRQFNQINIEEFPLTAGVLNIYTAPPEEKINTILHAALCSIARERGEPEENILPDSKR